jgi:hypothetical protein
VRPDREGETEELGEDVLARMNPVTGEVETLDVVLFDAALAPGPF